MKKIRQYLIWMVMLATVLLSLGVSHAATWGIGNYDGLTIDDAGISTTSGAPFGETSWVIRFGSSATDNYDPMWREWLWYRVGTTDKEASFSTLPATGAYNADSSAVTLTFNDSQVPARFNATVTFGVAAKTAYSYKSNVKKTITIHNLTSAELDYHLFSYSDLDISSGGMTDNVAIVKGERALQTGFDAVGAPLGYTLIQTSTLKPSAYSVDAQSTNPGSILDSLEKSGPTQLANDGKPYFQNSDMQFAFQYDLKIPANGTITFDITNNMVETKPLQLTYSQAGATCADYAQNATYQACVDNTTNTAAVNNVVLTGNLMDPGSLESNLSFVSATDNGVYDAANNTISWTLPTLAAGATKCFQATLGVNSVTPFTTGATVYSDETFPAQSSARTNLCNYPPRVTSIAPSSVLAGAAYTYQIVAADTENDPLVFALVKSPVGMTMNANGLISWTPTYAQHTSSNPVGVYVSDGHATIYYTFAVSVIWQNVAPIAPAMQTANGAEYLPLSYQVLASDPDNQLLTYTTSDPMPNGLTLGSTGILSGTPALSGFYVVNVRVTDPYGVFATTAVIINVATGVILPPAIVLIPNATINAPIAFNYSVSASDPQGQTLSYSLSSTPAAAGLVINATTGVISWPVSVAGAYTVTVTATNTSSKFSSQNFTLTVNPQIFPPIVDLIPNATITAPAAFSYGVIASDPQGQSLAYSFTYAPAGMTISPAGVINWSTSVAGKFNITVRVTNTSGRYTEKIFTLTVNAGTVKLDQTTGPISFTPATVNVGGTTTASATATSGLAVIFSSTTPTVCTVSGSTVTAIAAGTCTIAANQAGDASYNAAPQVTGNITAAAIIKTTPTITWAAPAPIAIGTALSATQLNATASVPGTFVYTPASGTVLAAGASQTLSVTFTPTDTTNYNGNTAQVLLTVNKADQTINPISFTPATVNVGGTTTASATATSGLAVIFSSTTPTVCTVSGSTITAIAVGTCTIAANQAGNTTYNAAPQVTQSITVAAIIKTTPTITWATPAAVAIGTALSATQLNATASVAGSFVYAPASGTVMNTAGNQTLSVVFTPTDTTNYNNGNGSVILTVNPAPPQPPTMTPIPAAAISAPAAFSYQVAASDPNGDALAYSLAGNPAGMSIGSTGLISWTPSVAGTYTITATATDPGTLKASQIFTLTVNGGTVELPPVITSTPVTNGYRNGYYYYQVAASDPNGGVLSYSLTTKPSGMTINSSTGLIYWRPSNTGTYSVTVKATDTTGRSASQSFTVTIIDRPSNSSPIITSLPVTSAKAGVLYNYDVNATDSNGDALYYRLSTAPSGMVIDLVSGIISWTPTSAQTGSISVTVEAVDSKGGRRSQSYTIQVSN